MNNSVKFSATAIFAVGLLLAGAGSASAATTLTVDPATGLTDGQVVSVAAAGFTANETVTILECVNSETDVACDLANQGAATTDDTGTAATTYAVHSAFTGVNPLTGKTTGPVDCTTGAGCSLIALDSAFAYASAPIAFG
ncbi:enediyne antibiotic chromoprotein [Amycolatopsis sp. RTGN1]|uniref:enediyne antibiotic chromoprotein n=1 Tax=Amycolatopsis ponsaeliensis TaxID=2992142 RepID=UPI00254A75EE|nr:enediyne antibiotic chromoprotein [Amycolatopsis sp. RTGN1]